MNSRILGYAVLAYAALTSGAVLPLVRLVLGRWDVGWAELSEAALWLTLLVGGFGLTFGRSWSRLVVLIGTAASVVLSAVGLLLLLQFQTPLEVVAFRALTTLPLVLLFVGTLRLPPPAAPQVEQASGPTAIRAVSPRVDLAYGCFAWIALVICTVPVVSLLPIESNTSQVLGMIVGIPVALATLVAGVGAIVLSILEWKAWPLLTMSAVTASIVVMFLAEEEWRVVSGNVAFAWYVGATAILALLCVRWFAFTRRRRT